MFLNTAEIISLLEAATEQLHCEQTPACSATTTTQGSQLCPSWYLLTGFAMATDALVL